MPGRPGGVGRRALWAVVAAVAALAVATALVLLRSSSGGKSDHATPSATSSATSSPSDPDSSAAPEASALPSGYVRVEGKEGFNAAVPKGWDRTDAKSPTGNFEVVYRSPDRKNFLRIFEMSEPTPGHPFEKVREREGFEELAKPESFEEGDKSGLRLEYQIGSPGKIWSVVDSRFKAGDGIFYSVAVHRAGGEGPADEGLFKVPLRYFCPPGATCGDVTSPP